MTTRPAVRPLRAGVEIAGFVVDDVVASTPETIVYRVHDADSGADFLLREYAPSGIVDRGDGGDLVAPDAQSAAAFEQGIARFLTDAARGSANDYPGLPRTIRGLRGYGTAYQLTSRPAGNTLSDLLSARGALRPAKVVEIARPLLDALEALHARARLHGEITPSLVWVPEAGGALLLGGGLNGAAHALPDDPYAAPEQCGENTVDGTGSGPWTDIYRLSATLYHALAGHSPVPAGVRHEALEAGREDPLDMLPAAQSAGKKAEATGELATLIERGLRVSAQDRPQDMREWRARISSLGAAPGALEEEARSPAGGKDRPGWAPVVFAATVLGIVVAVGFFALHWQRQDAAERADARTAGDQAQSAVEAERWRQALETHAVVGYRAFIAEFPDSSRVAQAREYIGHLEEQAWPGVLKENTRAAFEAHLQTFPEGRFATEAMARIEVFRQEEARLARSKAERERRDGAAWELARAEGTIAALDAYLADWPGGAHAAEARDLRARLQTQRNDTARFEEARAADTLAAWRAYVTDYPSGRHVDTALEAIDRLTLRPGTDFRDCESCPEMVVVPAGSFWQGSADNAPLAISFEKPRRRVVIDAPVAVGKYEVTMAQWNACVAAGGCETRPDDNGWGRGGRPVILVSWSDAAGYAQWLSDLTGERYSLPSESEWEYAARAGQEGDWLGGSAGEVCAYGNIAGAETGFDWRHPDCADRTAASTAIVGSYRPNAFGLYDVIGNVAEWTRDCMNLSYLEAPTDGSAWSRGLCSSRMTRGGSWFSGTRDIRLPARFNLKSGDRNDFTGFRVVRRIEPQQE